MSALIDLSEGAVFASDFRVVRPLAKGGMGAVYVVEQIATGRERALKLMHPMLVSDTRSRERFEREARVGSVIESDHVVEVIAAGVEERSSTPWLCMELLKGETLADRVEREGSLGRSDAIEVMKQLAHALGAAHRAGIVHRDLKPENVFLGVPRREGVPFTLKVLDFGVAALVAEAASAKTTQGVGSPMWMAPEQTDVGKVTRATDVWPVGLIAFLILTGRIYWKTPGKAGASLTALLVEIMVEPLAPPSERALELGIGVQLPDGFDAWFARCVHRDPAQRFQEIEPAIGALVELLGGVAGGSMRPPRSTPSLAIPQAFEATAVAATPGVQTGPMLGQPIATARAGAPPRPPPRRTGLYVAGGLAIALIGGCGALTWAIASGLRAAGDTLAQGGPSGRVTVGPDGIDIRDPQGGEVHFGDDGLVVVVPDGGTIRVAAITREEEPPVADPVIADPAIADPVIADPIVPDVAEERAPSKRPPRAPRLSPDEARFVAGVVRPCWEGNPRAGIPATRVRFELMLAANASVRNLRIVGLEDHTAFRSCVVSRAVGFPFATAMPAEPPSFATVLGPS